MNPSGISTPVRKNIDTWHFWINAGKRRVLVWDITLFRARDIESEQLGLQFTASLSKETEAEAKKLLIHGQALHAPSLEELKTMISGLIRQSEAPCWKRVVVVGTRSVTEDRQDPEGESRKVFKFPALTEPQDDYGLILCWGTGEECDGWYRSSADAKFSDNDPKRLLPLYTLDVGDTVVVYPHSEELLENLIQLRKRMMVIGSALHQLVTKENIYRISDGSLPALPCPTE